MGGDLPHVSAYFLVVEAQRIDCGKVQLSALELPDRDAEVFAHLLLLTASRSATRRQMQESLVGHDCKLVEQTSTPSQRNEC